MATKFVPPESAPLHMRILSAARPNLSAVVRHLEAFHAAAEAADAAAVSANAAVVAIAAATFGAVDPETGLPVDGETAVPVHVAAAPSSALAPSTAFQLTQLAAAIRWEISAKPQRAHIIRPRTTKLSSSISIPATDVSADAEKAHKKTSKKKKGSKWAN